MIGSLGSGGSGVREVDDTIRELRKENFNLKLRIYFLEERLGSSSKLNIQAGSKDELIQVYQVLSNCEFFNRFTYEKISHSQSQNNFSRHKCKHNYF